MASAERRIEPMAEQTRRQADTWRLKLRPRARIKVGSKGFRGDVCLRCNLEVFLGAKRLKVGEIEAEVRYRPLKDELKATIQIALLTW